MAIPDIHIEQIRPELTWKLRQQVLYPDKSVIDQHMLEDEKGIHFGAFYNNYLAGVVSLFFKGADVQFRKLAVDAALQKKGIGMQMLQYITREAVNNGAGRLWCNARTSALGFYKKSGFKVTGDIFYSNDIAYVIMEKTLRKPDGGNLI